MKVHWTRTAKMHLRAIHDHIASDSSRHGKRFVDVVTRRTGSLAAMPRLGAIVPEFADDSLREIFHFSYRMIYRIRSDRIDVVALIHGARELPPLLP